MKATQLTTTKRRRHAADSGAGAFVPAASTRQESNEPTSAANLRSGWPWWLSAIVIGGALLTATGAVMALFPSGPHLTHAGENYADYFATRNIAMAAMLVVTLFLKARRPLVALMTLTAVIQLLAAATGRAALIPIDVTFAAVFLASAARLCGQRPWRGISQQTG
ncbi:MAG: hypothetical protein ACRDK8_03875 [Solirubrobacteraceae bacterium]